MKILSAVILSTALMAGATGSALAYRHASDPGPVPATTAPLAAQPRPAAQVVHPGTRFRWAPCPAGSRLEKGVCVTHVVRTVVVPAPAAPAAPAQPVLAVPASVTGAPPAPSPAPVATTDDEAEDDHGDDDDHEDRDDGDHQDHEDHEDDD